MNELAATASAVRQTTSRNGKIALLASFLRQCGPRDIPVAVGLLGGEPRQGRIGVGWSQLAHSHVDVDARRDTMPTTLADFDRGLDDMRSMQGVGVVARRSERLNQLFEGMTVEAEEFSRDLLSGGLRQGAQSGVMVSAVAKAAEVPVGVLRRAAMLRGDLSHAAAIAFSDGAPGLRRVGLSVGTAVSPMLASTGGSIREACDALDQVVLQPKLDGIRIQAHKSGDDVELFTRRLHPVAKQLPHIVEVVRSFASDSLVLDGEVIGWHDGDIGTDDFADIASTFSSGGASKRSDLGVAFFDVLHCDGTDLIDEPLTRRMELLSEIAGRYAIDSIEVVDVAEAEKQHESWVRAGREGSMAKEASSLYVAGRRGKAWRKIKPVVTLDMVVLAAEWGHGRRTGTLSNLHLGVAGVAGSADHFVMVGKTFKGLTDVMLAWQTEALLERETKRSGITVYVRSELVVEIAIDGVQRSQTYPGGVTLRFARVKSYRTDKRVEEIDTISAVQALLGD